MTTTSLTRFLKHAIALRTDFLMRKPTDSFIVIDQHSLMVSDTKNGVGIRMTSRSIQMPVDGPERVSVSAKALMAAVNVHAPNDVTIMVANDRITVQSGEMSTQVPLFNQETYSQCSWPDEPVTESFKLGMSAFATLKRACAFLSTDELRPAMGRVLITTDGLAVATDGYRLVALPIGPVALKDEDVAGTNNKGVEKSPCTIGEMGGLMLRPRLIDIVQSYGRGAHIRFDANRTVAVVSDTIRVYQTNIGDKFPTWRTVWPLEARTTLILDRIKVLNHIKRLLPLTNSTTHQVVLRIDHESAKATLMAQDADNDIDCATTVPLDTYALQSDAVARLTQVIRMGFNARLLLTVLKDMDSGVLQMFINEPNRAAVFNGTHLLMPVMLND